MTPAFSLRLTGLVVVWILLKTSAALPAQENAVETSRRLPLLERVHNDSQTTFLLDDPKIVSEDARRMLTDLEQPGLAKAVEGFLGWEAPPGIWHTGIALNDRFDAMQLRAKDLKAACEFLGVSEKDAASPHSFALKSDVQFPLALLYGAHRAVFDGEDLLLLNHYFSSDWEDRAEEERVRPWLDRSNKLLWPHLDARSQAILLQSGLSLHNRPENDEWNKSADLEEPLSDFRDELTPAERRWLDETRAVIEASDRQVVGLKYHDRVLELRARAQIGGEKSFDKIVRAGSAEEAWPAALGLEREQLVLATAVQLDAFPDSAAARTLPRLALRAGSQAEGFRWLQGNMLRTLTELMGDSWNDLDAGRVALYRNDEAEKAGLYAIIGIADARDPAVVLQELERMSRLTSPEAASIKGADRDEEIARLIAELTSADSNLANRAETRLALAGQAALPALKTALTDQDLMRREAASRLVQKIEGTSGAGDSRLAVVDPGFWTTLNPGLSLKKSSGRISGFEAHTIHVTPDPSRTAEEVASAIQLMEQLFGPDWATIRVVQAGQHFVFMLGSDLPLLERMVAGVVAEKQELNLGLAGVGHCQQTGQLQFWFDGERILELAPMTGWENMPKLKNKADQPVWLGLQLEGAGAEISALVPIEHLISVAGLLFR